MELSDLKKRFIEIYGSSGQEPRYFTSPGRVNLIGEHTDYNGGYVFPAALSMGTTIVARPRTDNIIKLAATDLDARVSAPLGKLDEYKSIQWGNYQLGVAAELQKAGYSISGCDMLFDDTLPHGAGLSSSAAIEVATAVALVSLGKGSNTEKKEIDMTEMAKICQRAENSYIGVNCGIMDQFASAMGRADHAILLNCKDLSHKLVPLNMKGVKIVISNTNKKRSLGQSKYNERRSECERGLQILRKQFKDAGCLCEISMEQFESCKHLIEDEIVRKRVEHVISENDRVLKSVEALERNDLNTFGKMMVKSHESLKNMYEVTGAELDTLVEEALKVDGVVGSRMTGAGFGGCTVSLVRDEAAEEFTNRVKSGYCKRIGYNPSFYISRIGDGGREIRE